jgi:hypothetical protein
MASINQLLDQLRIFSAPFDLTQCWEIREQNMTIINEIGRRLIGNHTTSQSLTPDLRSRLAIAAATHLKPLKLHSGALDMTYPLNQFIVKDTIAAFREGSYGLVQQVLDLHTADGDDFLRYFLREIIFDADQESCDKIFSLLNEARFKFLFERDLTDNIPILLFGNSYFFNKCFSSLSAQNQKDLFNSYDSMKFLVDSYQSGSAELFERVFHLIPFNVILNYLDKPSYFLSNIKAMLIKTGCNQKMLSKVQELIPQDKICSAFEGKGLLNDFCEFDFINYQKMIQRYNSSFQINPSAGLELIYNLCPDEIKESQFSNNIIDSVVSKNKDLIPTLIKIYPEKILERIFADNSLGNHDSYLKIRFLKPSVIKKQILQLDNAKKFETTDICIQYEGESYDLSVLFKIIQSKWLATIENPGISNFSLNKVKDFLKLIPLLSLCVLSLERSRIVAPFIPYMEDDQMAASIPLLPEETLIQLIKTSDSAIQKSYFIRYMTLDQKKALVKELTFFSEELNHLHQVASEFLLKDSINNQDSSWIELQMKSSSMNIRLMEIKKIVTAFLEKESDDELSNSLMTKQNEFTSNLDDFWILMSKITQKVVVLPDQFPDAFLDRITFLPMENPVCISQASGYHVDKKTIQQFEKRQDNNGQCLFKNPLTREFLPMSSYSINEELKKQIDALNPLKVSKEGNSP